MLLNVSEPISESEEPSKQNQQERKENPSPGNEGSQGACGTPADEKTGNIKKRRQAHSVIKRLTAVLQWLSMKTKSSYLANSVK